MRRTHFDRKDLIGAACAALAIGLIGFLALDGWARADCRELLRFGDFASAEGDVTDPELAALRPACGPGRGPLKRLHASSRSDCRFRQTVTGPKQL